MFSSLINTLASLTVQKATSKYVNWRTVENPKRKYESIINWFVFSIHTYSFLFDLKYLRVNFYNIIS